eukprot:1774649-Amphidinium_carterae.1
MSLKRLTEDIANVEPMSLSSKSYNGHGKTCAWGQFMGMVLGHPLASECPHNLSAKHWEEARPATLPALGRPRRRSSHLHGPCRPMGEKL